MGGLTTIRRNSGGRLLGAIIIFVEMQTPTSVGCWGMGTKVGAALSREMRVSPI
jgi:hypothetical protein